MYQQRSALCSLGNVFSAHTLRLFDWSTIHQQLWLSRTRTNVEFAVRAGQEVSPSLQRNNTTQWR